MNLLSLNFITEKRMRLVENQTKNYKKYGFRIIFHFKALAKKFNN